MKIALGVSGELIEQHGVISSEVACDMARAARESLGADYGIGITGVAGGEPVEGHPPGTMHIAVHDGTGPDHVLHLLPGPPGNKRRAVTTPCSCYAAPSSPPNPVGALPSPQTPDFAPPDRPRDNHQPTPVIRAAPPTSRRWPHTTGAQDVISQLGTHLALRHPPHPNHPLARRLWWRRRHVPLVQTSAESPTLTSVPPFTSTPTPLPTATSGVPPDAAFNYNLVIMRPIGLRDTPASGQLYVSRGDGSEPYPISDYILHATFAGMPSPSIVYYSEFADDTHAVLIRLDLTTGVRDRILEYESVRSWATSAAISPDERYVAFINVDSLDVYNRESGETGASSRADAPACNPPTPPASPSIAGCAPTRPCVVAGRVRIAVRKGFYEGSRMVVVDVNDPVEHLIADDQMAGASAVDWSPDSQSICTQGRSDSPSGLFIASAPDWQATRYFEELDLSTHPDALSVAQCAWLANDRLAIGLNSLIGSGRPSLSILTLP